MRRSSHSSTDCEEGHALVSFEGLSYQLRNGTLVTRTERSLHLDAHIKDCTEDLESSGCGVGPTTISSKHSNFSLVSIGSRKNGLIIDLPGRWSRVAKLSGRDIKRHSFSSANEISFIKGANI